MDLLREIITTFGLPIALLVFIGFACLCRFAFEEAERMKEFNASRILFKTKEPKKVWYVVHA